mmetsp:Transcript_88713/g.251436  ORF Transcript_88713/g.251436 Transcript_88713/m.251436 type:complete len:221 (-) Transcript_88713:616-1278(-)
MPLKGLENQALKSIMHVKRSGRRKCSSAQSSCRLFCRGVPVSSRRMRHLIFAMALCRSVSGFLRRWPSSTITSCHSSLSSHSLRCTCSKFVTRTCGREPPASARRAAKAALRPPGSPASTRVQRPGANLASSCCQCESVDFGATTRCGPMFPLRSWTCSSRAIAWTVFPRPISSARMPWRPLAKSEASHSRPSAWCGMSSVHRLSGTCAPVSCTACTRRM